MKRVIVIEDQRAARKMICQLLEATYDYEFEGHPGENQETCTLCPELHNTI